MKPTIITPDGQKLVGYFESIGEAMRILYLVGWKFRALGNRIWLIEKIEPSN
jgi:hypothetical protein